MEPSFTTHWQLPGGGLLLSRSGELIDYTWACFYYWRSVLLNGLILKNTWMFSSFPTETLLTADDFSEALRDVAGLLCMRQTSFWLSGLGEKFAERLTKSAEVRFGQLEYI
jgi:hypothetical protein